MNIYIFNPQYVKIDCLNYLYRVLKVKTVYNLVSDEYIEPYVLNSDCDVVFDIRKYNQSEETEAWKNGVYHLVNYISSPIYNSDGILVSRELKNDIIDREKSDWHSIRNINNCGMINVMVLYNKYQIPFSTNNNMVSISMDFVALTINIIKKYTNVADEIKKLLVGVLIPEFICPQYGLSFQYDPLAVKNNWRRLIQTNNGRPLNFMGSYIIRAYRNDFHHGATADDFRKAVLTTDGYLKHNNQVSNHERWEEEERARIEYEEWARVQQEDHDRYVEECNREFNSMMDDFDAWGNID